MNREAWLGAFIHRAAPMFRSLGHPLPLRIRASVGWPHTNSRRVAGEIWFPSDYDGWHDIFISPLMEDTLQVGAILLHELAHAALGVEVNHSGPFIILAKALGFTRPWTDAVSSDRYTLQLRSIIVGLVKGLGPYPHTAITLSS